MEEHRVQRRKITENVKEAMNRTLTEYHGLTKELLDLILMMASNNKSSNASDPRKIMEKILLKDTEFQSTIEELEEHQRFQAQIAEIQSEIEKKDKIIKEIAIQLKKAETLLEEVVEDTKAKLSTIQTSNEGVVDVNDLIAYAHKISYTSAPPIGWTLGNHLGMFRPPQPQEDEMRSGNLVSNANMKI